MNVVKAGASNHTQREQGLEPPVRNAARNYGGGASSRNPLRNGVMLGRCSAGRNDTEVVTFGDREMDWARGAGDDLRIKASSRSSLSRPSYFSVQIQRTQALGGVDQTRQQWTPS